MLAYIILAAVVNKDRMSRYRTTAYASSDAYSSNANDCYYSDENRLYLCPVRAKCDHLI